MKLEDSSNPTSNAVLITSYVAFLMSKLYCFFFFCIKVIYMFKLFSFMRSVYRESGKTQNTHKICQTMHLCLLYWGACSQIGKLCSPSILCRFVFPKNMATLED